MRSFLESVKIPWHLIRDLKKNMDWHLHFYLIRNVKLLKHMMSGKKNYGKVSMGVVRTTYLVDEQGIIIKANDKVKPADDPENMLKELM